MPKIIQYAGQLAFYVAITAFIGYFSYRPIYNQYPEGMAQIKLSFAHGAARKIDCRKLTPQEIAKLPPKERRPNTCSRERIPLLVQLELDGKMLFDEHLIATGLSNDGPARTYRKFVVPPGDHTLVARMRDTKRKTGFDYESVQKVTLQPHQNLAIDFKADKGGFSFK